MGVRRVRLGHALPGCAGPSWDHAEAQERQDAPCRNWPAGTPIALCRGAKNGHRPLARCPQGQGAAFWHWPQARTPDGCCAIGARNHFQLPRSTFHDASNPANRDPLSTHRARTRWARHRRSRRRRHRRCIRRNGRPHRRCSGRRGRCRGRRLAGKGAAEAVNPTVEDAYWRDAYQSEPYYVAGRSYEEYRPAYELGWNAAAARRDADFDAFDAEWEREWTTRRGASHLDWDQARPAARAAWARAGNRDVRDETGTIVAPAYTGDIDNDDVVDVLNDLLESCRDGEYGFRTSSENADSPDLKGPVHAPFHRVRCCRAELEAEIRRLGGEPASGGTVAGALHRGWVS
ncbi:Collagen alpha-5(VI) chain [Manis javanica]|nr:Collagen alpha-5(VI) chain [Manis javanica]